jgi:hypothetical protein
MEPTENSLSPEHDPSTPPLPPLLSDEADVLTLEAEPAATPETCIDPGPAPEPAEAGPGAGGGAIFTLRESLPWLDPATDGAVALEQDQAVLLAPTGIDGLDRLLGGGLRLTPRGPGAAAPAVTVALSGPRASGKTVLGLHLGAAVCRAHRRGAVLYVAPEGALGEARDLLRSYGEAGFSWVSTLGARAIPAVASGLVLVPESGQPLPQQVEAACGQLPREQPLRAVVLDGVAASDAERTALAGALGRAGSSLILVGPDGGGPGLDRADLWLELGLDEEAHGPVLRVRGARRSPAHPEASLLSLAEGTARVMPPASLYPSLCRQAPGLMRGLPLSRFGDPTLDKRAGDRPWLRPQARVLMQGADPACLLLLANRFLAEAPQRLAMFFGGASARGPGGEDRGVVHLRRARTGAEVVAQVCEALRQFRQRWPRALAQSPRVALIDPAGLYADGRLDTSGPVLDAALLSVCGEAGVMTLVCRTATELLPWWSDYDLVLHLPQRTQGGVLTVRVVVDRM